MGRSRLFERRTSPYNCFEFDWLDRKANTSELTKKKAMASTAVQPGEEVARAR